jgi:UDP-N-acetylglucosamine 3-dehydrogenase
MTGFPKVRIGLVGCGAFGRSHLATLAGIPFVEVLAVTDVIKQRALEAAERYKIPHVATDFLELCSLEDLDAVSVATTEDKHLEPVLAAIEQHKHVFVEKPMATRIEDAERMLVAARKANVILMPGHILRFETKYATVKEQLENGQLGRIVCVYGRRNRPKSQGCLYKRTPLILETSIHDIDVMLWYTGKKVISVRAYDVSIEPGAGADLSCAALRFEGGAVGLLQTSWLLPDKAAVLDDCMQVITTSGVANIDVLHSGLVLWREEGLEFPDISYEPRLNGCVMGALREELSYFALCVLEGRHPTVLTAEDGVEALRVGLAVVESAHTDREVHLAGRSPR